MNNNILLNLQSTKLSVLIFRKLLRDNPKVLASFVRSELDKKDVQFIEEMIDRDDESPDFPKVYKTCIAVWDIYLYMDIYHIQGRKKEEHRFLYEVL